MSASDDAADGTGRPVRRRPVAHLSSDRKDRRVVHWSRLGCGSPGSRPPPALPPQSPRTPPPPRRRRRQLPPSPPGLPFERPEVVCRLHGPWCLGHCQLRRRRVCHRKVRELSSSSSAAAAAPPLPRGLSLRTPRSRPPAPRPWCLGHCRSDAGARRRKVRVILLSTAARAAVSPRASLERPKVVRRLTGSGVSVTPLRRRARHRKVREISSSPRRPRAVPRALPRTPEVVRRLRGPPWCLGHCQLRRRRVCHCKVRELLLLFLRRRRRHPTASPTASPSNAPSRPPAPRAPLVSRSLSAPAQAPPLPTGPPRWTPPGPRFPSTLALPRSSLRAVPDGRITSLWRRRWSHRSPPPPAPRRRVPLSSRGCRVWFWFVVARRNLAARR